MAFDYRKFEVTCRQAYTAAKKAAQSSDDGGTCNQDSVFVVLPYARKEKILDILSSAGLSGFEWRRFGRAGFLISTSFGQGAANERAMEAKKEVFKEAGYEVSGWYQID